jgi:methionine sulfoxide reductase catalytic subunit
MLIRRPEIPSSEITPEAVYLSRRRFLGQSAAALAGAAVPTLAACETGAAEGAQRDEPTPF